MPYIKEEPVEDIVGLAGERRMKDFEFTVPFIIGSYAMMLPKTSASGATHKWYVFMRGPNGEDLSPIVKKVVFQLHETFPSPRREVTKHPFEVAETGWGEFDILVEIHFQDDAQEAPLQLTHFLKLFHDKPNCKKPVLYEFHNELVFSEPSAALCRRLFAEGRLAGNRTPNHLQLQIGQPLSKIHNVFINIYDGQADLARLQQALRSVRQQMQSLAKA